MSNKVTMQDILNLIDSETFTMLPSGKVLVCELMLKNGFSVRGEASVVDKATFDMAIGMEISRKNAIDKIWQLEGYLLQEKLFNE